MLVREEKEVSSSLKPYACMHNNAAEKKLLRKQQARKSHDLPAKAAAGHFGRT
jgi:hypothetical protein